MQQKRVPLTAAVVQKNLDLLKGEFNEFKSDMVEVKELLHILVDKVATKDDLADLRTELKGDILDLRAEFRADLAEGLGGLRTEFKSDLAETKHGLMSYTDKKFFEVRGDILQLGHQTNGVIVTLKNKEVIGAAAASNLLGLSIIKTAA